MKWAKYYVIIMLSSLTNKTCVSLFGKTYLVAGNYVKRVH